MSNTRSYSMRRFCGFTMLELMITIALLAAIIGLAVPSFSSFVERQAINSDIQSFQTLLTSARSLAMTTNAGQARVCWNPGTTASTLGGVSIPPSSIATISFTDATLATAQIESVRSTAGGQSVYSTTEADRCIGFNSQGRLSEATTTPVDFRVCRAAGDSVDSKRLRVLLTGRVVVGANNTC